MPTQVNYVVSLEGVEEWRLVVGDSQHGGTEGHPFRIHVDSFEAISVNGKPLEPGTIDDTVWIPAESTVVIRIRFKQFLGKSVFHCHILPHEDTGMMQNQEARPAIPALDLRAVAASEAPAAFALPMPMQMRHRM